MLVFKFSDFSFWKTRVLFEQKKIKLWNKWHFVEKKMEIMQHFLKMQYISLLLKYITCISRDVFLIHVFMYVNIGCLKVKECMMLYFCCTSALPYAFMVWWLV
jgi:hypothetical protein